MLTNATILTAYIRAQNAVTTAWIADGPMRGACLTVEDAAHWAEYGVHTIAQYIRQGAEQYIWDLYKEVHGFRPRSINFSDMTDVELDDMQQSLLEYQRIEQEQQDFEQDAFDAYHSHAEEPEPDSVELIADDYIERKGW